PRGYPAFGIGNAIAEAADRAPALPRCRWIATIQRHSGERVERPASSPEDEALSRAFRAPAVGSSDPFVGGIPDGPSGFYSTENRESTRGPAFKSSLRGEVGGLPGGLRGACGAGPARTMPGGLTEGARRGRPRFPERLRPTLRSEPYRVDGSGSALE